MISQQVNFSPVSGPCFLCLWCSGPLNLRGKSGHPIILCLHQSLYVVICCPSPWDDSSTMSRTQALQVSERKQCLSQCHDGKLYCEWIIALFSGGRLCINLVPMVYVMHTAYCILPIFHHTTTNWFLGHTLLTPQPPLVLHVTICL